jgi:hypothetical protein
MAAAGGLLAVVIIISLSVGLARKSAMPYTCKDERGASYDSTFFVVSSMQRLVQPAAAAAAAVQVAAVPQHCSQCCALSDNMLQ